MKIGVFGNINAGKSYIVKKLITLFPQYDVVQIDAMRQKYGDGNIEGELLAQEQFISAIKNSSDVIFEFTGYGVIADKLYNVLEDNSMIILNVKTEVKFCLDRLVHKDFSLIPYPYKGDISDTIKNLSKVLDEQNFIKNFWDSKSITIFDIASSESLEKLNLHQYQ